MRKIILLAIFIFLVSCETENQATEIPYPFKDEALYSCVLFSLGQDKDYTITEEDFFSLKEIGCLSMKGPGIKDFSGISHFKNLERIGLSNYNIRDVTQLLDELKNLGKLTSISLYSNPLEDITPLFELSNIEELDISSTPITSLRGIGSMKNLKRLIAYESCIYDIDDIQFLQKLVFADLQENFIEDVNSMSRLSSLEVAFMNGNCIEDWSSLDDSEYLKENHSTITKDQQDWFRKCTKYLDKLKNGELAEGPEVNYWLGIFEPYCQYFK